MSLSNNYPTIRPTLEFDFANVGALDPRITFTRATSATFVNQLGVIQTAASGIPRFDYDPSTLAARGLLIEEARTNLCPYSEQLGSGSWNTAAVTFGANAGTAPTGETTADKISPASSGTFRFVYYDGLGSTLSSSTVYTISMFLKASGKNWGYLRYEDKSNTHAYVYFNLSTGVVGSTTGTLSVTSKIENYGNGWYRCSVTGNSGTGAGGLNPILVGVADADGSTLATLSGTDGILVWGAQLEAGSFATSYIPTVASAVTRNADVATVNTLTPWYNASAGTLFAEGAKYAVESGGRVIAELGDGTTSNIGELYVPGETTTGSWFVGSGGATSASISVSNTFPALTVGRIAGSYEVNSFQVAGNGALGTRDTSGAVPVSISALFIGKYGGGTANQWNGWIRRIAYYPRALSNAELQALTS